jgi:hypothetical protein
MSFSTRMPNPARLPVEVKIARVNRPGEGCQ